jgi:AraC-like DNA-binding protein
MLASALHHNPVAPIPFSATAVSALLVDERDRDLQGVVIPHPEVHLGVRFGPSAHRGLDIHAMGVRPTVHRKLIRGGQRMVTARLHLGAHEAVLGVPASEIAGRVVPLEDLWGQAATRRLFDCLSDASTTAEAATVLESAIEERFAAIDHRHARPQLLLALAAAERLTRAHVGAIALELGVSERHLRRVFRDSLGVSPKTFARLGRFRTAVRLARQAGHPDWASIAASSGYYDQAHLIAEFRTIAGVTPRELLAELRAGPSLR